MRVLLALHHPRGIKGGAPGATLRIGNALERAGCTVDYAFYDEVLGTHSNTRFALPRYPWALARHAARFHRRHHLDVIDASSGDAWVLGRLRRPLLGEHSPALITRTHGLEHLYHRVLQRSAAAGEGRLSWRYHAYYGGYRLWEVAQSLRLADRAILLNSGELDYVHRVLGVPAERLDVLALPLPEAFLDAAQRRARKPSPAVRLLYIGNWVASKGVGALAAALATVTERVTTLQVTLVGTGVDGAAVMASLPSPLRTMVTVVPSIANDRVPALLDEHDIFVLPSRSEGASVALSEAMARGLAVVATTVGAAPDHVTHGVDGLLVPPDDVEAMAAAISSLAGDASLRARLGAAAATSAQRHRSDNVAARTIEVYEAALRAQTPRRRRINSPMPAATASAPAAAPTKGHGELDVDGAGPLGA